MNEKEMAAAAERISAYYRRKGFDLTKAKDLKQALILAVAAFRDYCHYESTLSGLIGDLDESIEEYDTASWFNMSLAPEMVDDLAADGMRTLNAACMALGKLSDRAKDNCVMILKKALDTPAATQKTVLGRAYKIEPAELDARIEELFDALLEVDYHHAIPDNYNEFLLAMGEVWQAVE